MDYSELSAKKSRLDGMRPFPDDVEAELKKEIVLELTCTGNCFDGVSLNRRETASILFDDEPVPGHSLTEHIRTLNVAKAFEKAAEKAKRLNRPLDDNDVRNIHRIIVRGLDDDNAGMYRGASLTFGPGGPLMPDPVRVQRMMDDLGMWLYTVRTLHPVMMAAEAHLRLMSIWPFAEGNVRTARTLMNLILLTEGYPPALFSRREKKEYWSSLEKAVFKNDREDYDRLIYRAVNRSLEFYLKAGREKHTGDVEAEPYFLRIGQLAKETGERVSTLRYWTGLNLLETAGKTSADYTLYSSEVIPKIRRLKELKEQRYTLDEIRKILYPDE